MNRLLAASLSLAIMTGCGIDGTATEAAIDPRVSVLTHVPGPQMTVTPAALEFPRADNDALLALAPGDLVVSSSGEGFLRTVDAVSATADRIVIATTDAELGDALIDGLVEDSFGGEGKADTHQLPSLGFSIANKTVMNNAAMTVTVLGASVVLRPEIDLDLDIRRRQLQLFEMVVRGNLTGSIDLSIDAREAVIPPEITLWESPPSFFYQQIGFLPVVETVRTSVRLQLGAVARGDSHVRIHADASASLQAGIHYDDESGWSPVAGLGLAAHASASEASVRIDQLGVQGWLIARADVKLYGLVGPYIGVGPQFEVVRDLVEGDFDGSAGFRGEVGGDLRVGPFNVLRVLPKLELFNRMQPVF